MHFRMFIFSLITTCFGDWKDNLKHKVDELKRKGQSMYGDFVRNSSKQWNFDPSDKLTYPRGDKQKLQEISSQWSEYYSCSLQLTKDLENRNAVQGVTVTVYRGATAFVDCSLCVSPQDRDNVTWWYSSSLKNDTFEPLAEKETIVEDGNLTIYNVGLEDAGVYHCQIGDSSGNMVLLEVLDHEESYVVVKPQYSKGPYPKSPVDLGQDVILHSEWSRWSECSKCDRVGRRRRFGICYISLNYELWVEEAEATKSSIDVGSDYMPIISKDIIQILKVFKNGVWCRSKFLPKYFREHTVVKGRQNEIMIGLCKVECKKDLIFEVVDPNGRVIERANNSGGVYSLLQTLPPQPSAPPRDIMFVTRMETVNITCPGTTLKDMPVTWKIGTLDVEPRDLYVSSRGRMYVSARDQLVITAAKYTDTNIYSCWQDSVLAGTVKLEVWEGGRVEWNHHLALLATVLTVGVCLKVALGVLDNKRRKIGLL